MNIADIGSLAQQLVWERDYRDRPWWVRAGVEAARLVLHVLSQFTSGELTLRAMGLVYTTILSLVPLLAITFSVLKGLGVQARLEPLLVDYLAALGPEKATEIAGRIVGFVDNIDVRVLGAAGLGLLLYTVVSLMKKIETALNHVWRVERPRAFGERFATFLSVLTVGPVLVFSALALTGSIMHHELMQRIAAIEPFGSLIDAATRVTPYVLVIAAFTFIYVLVPNTRVRLSAALSGGAIAGVLWQAAGWLFASFVSGAGKYQAIYATFGTMMLFMIWLYVNWLILLVGASAAFYVQHPQAVLARVRRLGFSARSFEEAALALLGELTRREYAVRPPATAAELGQHLSVPDALLDEVAQALASEGFVRPTADSPHGWVLIVASDQVTVADVIGALRGHAPRGTRDIGSTGDPAAAAAVAQADEAIRQALGATTLRAFAARDPERADARPSLAGPLTQASAR